MNTAILIRQRNYYGWGKNLAEARKNYKKVSGRVPTNTASILSFSGLEKDLDTIEIDDVLGSVRYPKTVTVTEIN